METYCLHPADPPSTQSFIFLKEHRLLITRSCSQTFRGSQIHFVSLCNLAQPPCQASLLFFCCYASVFANHTFPCSWGACLCSGCGPCLECHFWPPMQGEVVPPGSLSPHPISPLSLFCSIFHIMPFWFLILDSTKLGRVDKKFSFEFPFLGNLLTLPLTSSGY